ncbi:Dolichyl-phosphate beta-glucosyltransferase [Liparis tanakae]|uniref:Dolichyl-phosphate beta-glucosyltransferase n=1 Tax=Liparis tanakae TaxID=230148 RepID=A0A4Z2HCF4_9TELE|nr:Dolichyl-phosphate beta-glucosyltransferase [Liparis tanakae]
MNWLAACACSPGAPGRNCEEHSGGRSTLGTESMERVLQSGRRNTRNVQVAWARGSKLVPFWSWLQMGRDLVLIRLRYLTRAWKLQSPRKMD